MARRTIGSGRASSLVTTSNSLINKANSYNDAIAGYTWEQSYKTEADLATYRTYLDKRMKTVTDPAQHLSIIKTIDSANRSFTSEEIQRSSQSVLVGGGTEEDKLAKIASLYDAARQNGDMNLAQNLYGQYNTQFLKIENQRQAASSAAEAASSKYQTQKTAEINAMIRDKKDELRQVEDEFKKNGNFIGLGEDGKPKTVNGKTLSIAGAKAKIYDDINALAAHAAEVGLDAEHLDTIRSAAGDILNNPEVQKTFKILNLEAGTQNPQHAVQTADGWEAKDNPNTGIAAGQNATGQFQFTPVFNTQNRTSTDIMTDQNKGALDSIKKSLTFDGISHKQNEDGTFSIFDPQSQREIRATLDPNTGSLRYIAKDQSGNDYMKQVIIDPSQNRAKNPNPFTDISFQQLQAEEVAAKSQPERMAAEQQVSQAKETAAKQNYQHSLAVGPGMSSLTGADPAALIRQANVASVKAREIATRTQMTAALPTLQALPRANPSIPASYNPVTGKVVGAAADIYQAPDMVVAAQKALERIPTSYC
jgi:hypothetical protein